MEKIRNRTKYELEKLEKEYALVDRIGSSFTYVGIIVIVVFYNLIFLCDSFKVVAFIRSGCIFDLPLDKKKIEPSNNPNINLNNKNKNTSKNQAGIHENPKARNNLIKKLSKPKKTEAQSIRNETEMTKNNSKSFRLNQGASSRNSKNPNKISLFEKQKLQAVQNKQKNSNSLRITNLN